MPSQTPNSSLVPYATNQDFLTRQDWSLVGQLAADVDPLTNQPMVYVYVDLLNISSTVGLNVYTALLDASGDVEAAATRGLMYQPADLQGLVGASLAYLKRVVCDIAMMNLYDRRDGQNPPTNVEAKYKRAQEFLQQLVEGERVFGDLQDQEAGLPSNAFFSQQDLINNRLVTANYPRAFGIRVNQAQRGFGTPIGYY